jgi:SAM-dependent methyltransferase
MNQRSPGFSETDEVRRRYARRQSQVDRRMYHPMNPAVWQAVQERERAMFRLFSELGWDDLSSMNLVEVGCGGGTNLLELLQLGFLPENLTGIELLEDRLAHARHVLPQAIRLIAGDACAAPVEAGRHDIVLQSTVFSSLLDESFQQRLADRMWRWLRPGGGVLWYDFTYDNPSNADVVGIPVRRIRALFPTARLRVQRVTLAPPINRLVTRIHPALYSAFNLLPVLRTHVLAWIEKS